MHCRINSNINSNIRCIFCVYHFSLCRYFQISADFSLSLTHTHRNANTNTDTNTLTYFFVSITRRRWVLLDYWTSRWRHQSVRSPSGHCWDWVCICCVPGGVWSSGCRVPSRLERRGHRLLHHFARWIRGLGVADDEIEKCSEDGHRTYCHARLHHLRRLAEGKSMDGCRIHKSQSQ